MSTRPATLHVSCDETVPGCDEASYRCSCPECRETYHAKYHTKAKHTKEECLMRNPEPLEDVPLKSSPSEEDLEKAIDELPEVADDLRKSFR